MAKKKKQPELTTVEQHMAKQIVDIEYATGKSNVNNQIADFESAIDMLECERTEKNADWMSDIFIPEFTAQMLTQSSEEANQYFQTRDFVEVYLEDASEEAMAKADANKELINRTLNQRHLRHYQKFMRANVTKDLGGEVVIKCGWERKVNMVPLPKQEQVPSETIDVYGNALVDLNVQQPALETVSYMEDTPIMQYDRFNYDVIDRRNIFMDNTYCYSLQEKQWLIQREEKTLQQLRDVAEQEDYINLDVELKSDIETQTSQESYNKDDRLTRTQLKDNELYDVIHRYGKFWAIVQSRDDFGLSDEISIGLDDNGKPKDKAELVECIISFILSGSTKHLIRFTSNKFRDAQGNVFRPFIRGLCYIHPTKDWGLGDGKFCRELQIGINDTFNVSNDRVMLATIPTLKGKKYALEDNTSIYFEPNHVMQLESPDDLVEFQISDNVQGALTQISMLRQFMSGVTSIFPPALGGTPELSSTTATAVAGSEQNKNKRTNYKALTFEHTFLNEFYWMITQMTWQFAKEDTALKLMGEKVYDFDPTADFTYKPLSQSIETEYSKASKIRELTQMMGFLAPVTQVNPGAIKTINFMLMRIFKLYGDEMADFAKYLIPENGMPMQGAQQPQAGGMPTSNQNAMPQSGMEQNVRMNA